MNRIVTNHIRYLGWESLTKGPTHLLWQICFIIYVTFSTSGCWTTQSRVSLFGHQVSFGTLLDSPPRLVKSPRSPWSCFPLRSFTTKGWSLHVSRTMSSTPLHTKNRRVEDVPASHQDSKDGRRTKIQYGSLENQLTRHNTLLSHSLKS